MRTTFRFKVQFMVLIAMVTARFSKKVVILASKKTMFLPVETFFLFGSCFGVFYVKMRVFMVKVLILSIKLSSSCTMCFI